MMIVLLVFMIVMMMLTFLMLMFFGSLEKIGFQFQGALQVEASHIENLVEIDGGVLSVIELGDRIHFANPGFSLLQLVGRHEVGFVKENYVSKTDLLANLPRIVEVKPDMLGIDNGHDAIEGETFLHFLVR